MVCPTSRMRRRFRPLNVLPLVAKTGLRPQLQSSFRADEQSRSFRPIRGTHPTQVRRLTSRPRDTQGHNWGRSAALRAGMGSGTSHVMVECSTGRAVCCRGSRSPDLAG